MTSAEAMAIAGLRFELGSRTGTTTLSPGFDSGADLRIACFARHSRPQRENIDDFRCRGRVRAGFVEFQRGLVGRGMWASRGRR